MSKNYLSLGITWYILSRENKTRFYSKWNNHALIDKKLSADDIMKLKKDMKAELEKQGIHHSVIEFEWEDEHCDEGKFCNE